MVRLLAAGPKLPRIFTLFVARLFFLAIPNCFLILAVLAVLFCGCTNQHNILAKKNAVRSPMLMFDVVIEGSEAKGAHPARKCSQFGTRAIE